MNHEIPGAVKEYKLFDTVDHPVSKIIRLNPDHERRLREDFSWSDEDVYSLKGLLDRINSAINITQKDSDDLSMIEAYDATAVITNLYQRNDTKIPNPEQLVELREKIKQFIFERIERNVTKMRQQTNDLIEFAEIQNLETEDINRNEDLKEYRMGMKDISEAINENHQLLMCLDHELARQSSVHDLDDIMDAATKVYNILGANKFPSLEQIQEFNNKLEQFLIKFYAKINQMNG